MNSRVLNLTMLYVEDDADTRKSLTALFQNKVKKLYVAKDGAEALEIFKKHKIHFIISDHRMPKMSGTELCARVKELNSYVSFVLLTAYNDTNLLIQAIDSGVDKFIQKPVNAKQLFGTMHEIEEKIMSRFQLEKSTVCLQEAERIALLSYWDVNLTTREIHFSQEALELFGITNEVESATLYSELAKSVYEKDREKFIKIFEKRVFEEDKLDEVIGMKNSDGVKVYIHIIAKRWESSACGNKHVVGMFQDVSHYELQKQLLIKESRLDPMLPILNKKHIFLELEKLIKSSKRYGHALGVIFFDIDNFKAVNDNHGHLIGDDLLLELSCVIKNEIRQSDLFGRWGGDEFVIVTGYSSPDSTIELARKINENIQKYKWTLNIHLSVSMGLAFYQIGDDVNSLLQRADEKMLEAKCNGKARYNY